MNPLPLTRRRLLQGSGALAATSFAGTMAALHTRNAHAATGKQSVPAASPYGEIAPVADEATGLPLLALPAGFSYRSYGWTGDPMADGRPTPGSHDGMAVVGRGRSLGPEDDDDDDEDDDRDRRDDDDGHDHGHARRRAWVLVRNHERGLVAAAADALIAPHNYDTGAINGILTLPYGGITIRIGASGIVTNPTAPDPTPFTGFVAGGNTNLRWRRGRWLESTSSIGGTAVNCAGGPTPWGSWLTCEETLLDFSTIGGSKHGYVFETAADPERSIAAPIVGMGRFAHEAVAVDPHSGYVYETEDNRNIACFYRYKPGDRSRRVGALQRGGTLAAARIKSIVQQARPQTLAQANDTGLLNPDIGDCYELEWVDIADPDATPVVVAGQPGGVSLGIASGPTYEALGKGCARMARGEGIWYSNRRMFIVDTAAGLDATLRPGRGEGAVWELDLRTMRLCALFVSANQTVGNNPDNITVSPRGGVLLCEDGGLGDAGARLLGLNAAGEAYTFCRNTVNLGAGDIAAAGKLVAPGDYRGSEFAGACFTPGGRTLFAGIQTPGITFAIRGPWRRGNL